MNFKNGSITLNLHSTFLWYVSIFLTWLEINGNTIANKSIFKHCLIQSKAKMPELPPASILPKGCGCTVSTGPALSHGPVVSFSHHLGSQRMLYIRTPDPDCSVGFLILSLKVTFLFCERLHSQVLSLKVKLILGLDFVTILYWWHF